MTIQRPNCMKTLRQGSVSISLSRLLDLAPVLAGVRRERLPVSRVAATRRAPWPITESDRFSGLCVADQLPNDALMFVKGIG
jgi:hypothetical protein